DRAVVLPTADAPPSDNPYIAYNCLRRQGNVVLVANGSHVDPAIEKASQGYGLRDALALSLLALDYEHDAYNTPRIAAGLDVARDEGYLGIVAQGKLLVRRMDVAPGRAYLIATYELTDPTPIALAGESAETLCDALFECAYEHPVAALAVRVESGEMRMATRCA
ncbi:MAG: IMP cyclohydrolase, partial [Chloroflexi bacterium]|nr:IMP cyclohydrolase [Chloroflexota bacterium]